jgi:hypothetical protein
LDGKPAFEVGQKVQVLWNDGLYYRGVFLGFNSQTRYEVMFDDHDIARVRAVDLQPFVGTEAASADTAVSAASDGKRKRKPVVFN